MRIRSLLLLAALGACARGDEAPPQAAAPPRTVHVTATDFAFQAPDTLPAGWTSFHLMNSGSEPHHLIVVRLPEGKSLADVMGGPGMPPDVVFAGGPNVATPGGTAEATVELEPGRYTILCVIPSTDGQPHVAKGMVKEVTVVAADGPTAAPEADLTITLSDYAFTASGPLTAGRHVIKVDNTAGQPHEIVIVRLEPGKTVEEMARWAEAPQGPPPGTFLGSGTGPISAGEVNYVTAELTPGEYGFICFLPDAKDGKVHLLHGMIRQFTVQ